MKTVRLVAERRLMRAIVRIALLIACAPALVLSSFSPAFATISCSAGNVTLNYGSYDVLAGTVLDAAGSITVQCSKSPGGSSNKNGNVTYTAALTPLTPRQLAPPSGADRLSHQLYLDSARIAQPWGDGTGGTFVITRTFPVPRDGSAIDAPQNFYGRITPGGQDVSPVSPGPAPTTYTQQFTVTVTCTAPAVAC
jgi:spore coat protein U-like protein